MSTAIACILGRGDWAETNRAVASAQAFGLAVAVGDTGRCRRGTPHPQAHRFAIPWDDDFAAARNRLAARVAASEIAGAWLLWLDSDETLEAFPAGGIAVPGPLAAVGLIDRDDLTPRAALRLQRRAPLRRWRHAIHETLPWDEGEEPPLLGAVTIRHHGYADPARVAAKARRNRAIVARERARGADYFALALEEARAARGAAAVLAWLRAFNHPDAAPRRPGGFDRRWEAALALCRAGYPGPARAVAAMNSRIAPLALALLAAEARPRGTVDAGALGHVVQLLNGGGDPRYPVPRAFVGVDRATLVRHLATAPPATWKEAS